MPTLSGSIRRLALTPSLAEVTFRARGFPVEPSPATERLEAIPQAVICGFEWAIDSRSQWEVERRLGLVEPELRGFAFEGATMAFTIRDAFAGHRAREFLLGPGRPHIFLTYIGIGFAMARLPRRLWSKVLPDLTGTPYYPTMSWLAVDGYGFDRAYFLTEKWVEQQFVPAAYPWAGDPGYFLRAVDQGIGRALWFIHGADAAAVGAHVSRFASHRQGDLWSGVGLAAVFAGGCDPGDLEKLALTAGEFHADLSLGAVLAVKARDYAGFVPDATHAAMYALTRLTAVAAVELADRYEVLVDGPAGEPAYELWRRAIRAYFAARVLDVLE